MLTVLVIPADIKEPCYLRAIEGDTLKGMQGIVGGYIECVRLDEGIDLWLNEEGKLTGLPANERASYVADGYLFAGDYIAGDAFLASSNAEGDTVSLPMPVYTTIMAILDRAYA